MKKQVDIYDEENSIVIDDDFDTTEFNFLITDKKFTVSRSIKDDCFYSNQIFQYKISTNPIEIYIRTLESSHEPPLKYSIRDGVVLESEIKKDDLIFPDRIEKLNHEVEWHEVPIFGNYEINLYILSKHPEIISREDYRKFLRESIERIKSGVINIKEIVKNDKEGLQIINNEYNNKKIWTTDMFRPEIDFWQLSKEERIKTEYGKKIDYLEKLSDSLFKKDSIKYVGISEYEFSDSEEIISYIETLLDKKEITNIEKDSNISQNNNHTITILIYLITIFFVILKLTDSVYWNWFAVISPVLIWESFGFLMGFLKGLSN